MKKSIVAVMALFLCLSFPASQVGAAEECRRYNWAAQRDVYELMDLVSVYKVFNKQNALGEMSVKDRRYQRREDLYRWREQDNEDYLMLKDAAVSLGVTVSPFGHDCVYSTATKIFNDISSQEGDDSEYLKIWLSNQMYVFDACSKSGFPKLDLKSLPDEPERAVFDRAYQSASFMFYIGEYDKAVAAYQKIYDTPKHPYRGYAGYMVGRILAKTDALKAYDWINQMATDKSLKAYKDLIDELRLVTAYHQYNCAGESCVAFNTKHLQFISTKLLSKVALRQDNENYKSSLQQLDNYLSTFPDLPSQSWWFTPADMQSSRMVAYQQLSQTDEFLDWMQTEHVKNPVAQAWASYLDIQDCDQKIWRMHDAALKHAIDRWHAGDGDEWLYLAAMRIYPTHAAYKEISTAALAAFSNAEYFHDPQQKLISIAIRPHLYFFKAVDKYGDDPIKLFTGKQQDDYQITDQVIALFLKQKRFNDLKALGESYAEKYKSSDLLAVYSNFSKNSDDAFRYTAYSGYALGLANALSLTDILDKLERDVFSTDVAIAMSRVAFVRAVLLNNHDLFKRAAQQVSIKQPSMGSEIAILIKDSKGNPNAWQVTYFLLKMPSFTSYAIEVNRDYRPSTNEISPYDVNNWWCKLSAEGVWEKYKYSFFDRFDKAHADADAFFAYATSDDWIATDELEKLAQQPSGPEFLSLRAIALARDKNEGLINELMRKYNLKWGEQIPIDEMLHLAVKTTRYGCGEGAFSHDAFRLLHKYYPSSPWAKKTRYWYAKRPGRAYTGTYPF